MTKTKVKVLNAKECRKLKTKALKEMKIKHKDLIEGLMNNSLMLIEDAANKGQGAISIDLHPENAKCSSEDFEFAMYNVVESLNLLDFNVDLRFDRMIVSWEK